MYRYIDREIATLNRRERVLLLAMRDWIVAARRGRCPVEAISLRFVSHRVVGGIEPFHAVMTTLARFGRQRLVLCCPCTPRVAEDEAILLAALVGTGAIAGRRRDLAHLVKDRGHAGLQQQVADLDAALLLAGLC